MIKIYKFFLFILYLQVIFKLFLKIIIFLTGNLQIKEI
jgi:hypothetical protein